jgi:hypothetical protein
LQIDQGLQLEQSAPPLPPRPRPESKLATTSEPHLFQRPLTRRKLWPFLHADYDAETPEVLLNLASCLLSQNVVAELFSVTSRFRDPETRQLQTASPLASPFFKRSSWVPDPSSWTSRTLEPFSFQGGASFAACTSLPNHPKISFDGRMLLIDAMKLDTINDIHSPGNKIISDLNDIRNLPGKYPFTGESTLQALADVYVAGLLGGSRSPPSDTVAGCCVWLDFIVQNGIEDLKTKKIIGIPRATGWYLNLDAGYEHSTDHKIAQLLECFDALKAKYPQLPWPVPGQEPSKEDSQRFARYRYAAVNPWRRAFQTKQGYLGLGPVWSKKGGVVMLVKGGYVPYIFTHVVDDLRRHAAYLKQVLEVMSGKLETEEEGKLKDQIVDIEAQIGEDDGWILVGEAYVEGVMNGEAVRGNEERFGRVHIF